MKRNKAFYALADLGNSARFLSSANTELETNNDVDEEIKKELKSITNRIHEIANLIRDARRRKNIIESDISFPSIADGRFFGDVLNEKNEQATKELAMAASNRYVYGKYNDHYKWDLAVKWFQMSNDGFFKLYGFNFVPKGELFDAAKSFVHNHTSSQITKAGLNVMQEGSAW